MRIRDKKGQMEVIGLAVVVILVTFIMLFVVRFVVLQKPQEFKKEFGQIQLATNTIDTILKTTAADCHGLSFTELFQDCTEGESIVCEDDSLSCIYLESELTTIFSNSLDEWNVQYDFIAETHSKRKILDTITGGEGCKGDLKSKRFTIPTSFETLYLIMNVC